MATQTVGVCNVLTNMDEVFGRSYHLPCNGAGTGNKQSELCSPGITSGTATGIGGVTGGSHKAKNGSSSTLSNCNRLQSNPGGIATAATNTEQQQHMPPSYQSAVNTGVDSGSPTRISAVRSATVGSNGGSLLAERPSPVSHQNRLPNQHGNSSNSTFDIIL